MKQYVMPLFLMFVFHTMANAQSDSDTDPNRWVKVKSWQGSYSLTCTDSDSLQEGDTTTIVTHTIDISGIYEMSWSSPTGPHRSSWQETDTAR